MDQRLRLAERSGDEERIWTERRRLGLRRLIGLSFSYCVQKIIDGDVKIEEIDTIFASTTGLHGDNYEVIIEQYVKSYWSKPVHERQERYDYRIKRECVEPIILALLPRVVEKKGRKKHYWLDGNQEWGHDGEQFWGTYIEVLCFPRKRKDKSNSGVVTTLDGSRTFERTSVP